MRHPIAVRMLAALTANRPAVVGLGYAVAGRWNRCPSEVHPAERDLTAGMPAQRRAEFLLGRDTAHRAMADAGVADAGVADGPVLVDGRRPLFPSGVVGSLSHSRGVAVAIVADATRVRSVGIDIETSRLPIAAAHLVLSERERAWMAAGRTPASRRHRLMRAFSAKETAYKALDPLLDDGAPTLRRIRLRPTPCGFQCWVEHRSDLSLSIIVRNLNPGVLTWSVLWT